MVEAGLGITILPASVLRMDRGHGLMSRPIQNPKIDREVGLIQLRGRSLSPAAERIPAGPTGAVHGVVYPTEVPDLFPSSISHIREFELLESHPETTIEGRRATHNRHRRHERSLMRGLCWLALLAASCRRTRRSTGRGASRRTPGLLAYERLTGHFYGELDPKNALNAVINDILLAPRNARGHVEYSATFTLLRPVDSSKVSGVLWYEVPNRGNSPLNPRPSLDALTAGHILVSSGWQGDLAPRAGAETITVPVARNADGSSITGPVLYRISNVRGSDRFTPSRIRRIEISVSRHAGHLEGFADEAGVR